MTICSSSRRPIRPAAACSSGALLLAVCGFAAGCGSGSGLVPVSGRVTVDGAPLSEGRIEFFPANGRPASGAIGDDGSYRLTTYDPGDGAMPGEYVVTVTARQTPEEVPRYASMEDELNGTVQPNASPSGPTRIKWLAPLKYSNRSTSGLTATVGDGEGIDFDLQSKP